MNKWIYTSIRVDDLNDVLSSGAKVFNTFEEAVEHAKKMNGEENVRPASFRDVYENTYRDNKREELVFFQICKITV